MKEKIAIITDSGTDVNYNKSEDLFILPLSIQINDQVYVDGVDIELDTALDKLDTHKITTSLPNPEVIISVLDRIKALGYTHVIAVTISGELSGTFNIIRMMV